MLERRSGCADPRIVRDLTFGHGHVEVLAHEDTFGLDVDGGDRSFQSRAAMWLIRSTIRQLKPHSLSYQLTTFAHVSPSMRVRGASTIEECGLPLKSDETSSS